jgi:hypothetical protein
MKSDLELVTRAHLDVCAELWGEWDTLDFVLEYALMMLERIVKIEREIEEEHNIATSTTLDYESLARTIRYFRHDVLGEKGGQQ